MLPFRNFHFTRRALATAALSLGLLCGVQTLHAQGYGGYRQAARSPVDQTIENLKNIAARNTYSGREMERYDNAMTHLSQFAEKLQMGRFDRGKLDRGIDDVKNVLNHNPMDGRARDILNNDLNELYRFRASYSAGYR